jgi:hypothetical protein
MQRVVIVSGGVLTARNFGLIWVSGRAPGAELALALRASELWEKLVAVVLGSQLPPTRRRWAGVYSQATGPDLYFRALVAAVVVLITDPGGRGMTLAPAIAEQTFAASGIA